jgi:hypothetical protein
MRVGNAAVLKHRDQGRSLRLFMGVGGVVTYEGEFEVDRDKPWYPTDAHETEGGPLRQVIVFRLRPVDVAPKTVKSKLTEILNSPVSADVPIEQQQTEVAYVSPRQGEYEIHRREQRLVLALEKYLHTQGHEISRKKLLPPGEARPLFTDLYDSTTGTLVEAKGTVARNAIRMAIGQLADYKRFIDGGRPGFLAVLVPSKPRQDLLDLLASQGIEVIYPDREGFIDTRDGDLLAPISS